MRSNPCVSFISFVLIQIIRANGVSTYAISILTFTINPVLQSEYSESWLEFVLSLRKNARHAESSRGSDHCTRIYSHIRRFECPHECTNVIRNEKLFSQDARDHTTLSSIVPFACPHRGVNFNHVSKMQPSEFFTQRHFLTLCRIIHASVR